MSEVGSPMSEVVLSPTPLPRRGAATLLPDLTPPDSYRDFPKEREELHSCRASSPDSYRDSVTSYEILPSVEMTKRCVISNKAERREKFQVLPRDFSLRSKWNAV